jgi:hypothetical protein
MKRFDLEKARKIVADEQAMSLAAGNPIAYNDPLLNRVLVRDYASGKRERLSSTSPSEANQDSGAHPRQNFAAG